MRQTTQNTMQAVAIDRFGGLETLTLRTLPAPRGWAQPKARRGVHAKGSGSWMEESEA